MGIFNGLMGNASEVNLEALKKEYGKILASSETIEKAYKLLRVKVGGMTFAFNFIYFK